MQVVYHNLFQLPFLKPRRIRLSAMPWLYPLTLALIPITDAVNLVTVCILTKLNCCSVLKLLNDFQRKYLLLLLL
jgi:hypothetical protein